MKTINGNLKSLIVCVLWLVGANASFGQKATQPNIVIILADDLGWGDVGYHGSSIRTPNIDKFAAEGIELKRFYTAAVCTPTRAGLMTGRYPDRMGLRSVIPPWSSFGVDTSELFLPQALGELGYKNRALIGKWHLGHSALKYHPLNRGFTHFYGFLNGNLDYFTHEREGQLDWHEELKPNHDQGYTTDLLTDEAIRCMKKYTKDSPFFIYLALNAPHAPLQAKTSDLLKYGYDPTKPAFEQNGKEGKLGRGNTKAQTYAAMVSGMDENVGRVLQALKDLHIEDNTIVLFQSDNGPETDQAGSSGELRGSKGTEWEGGVRAPAVIRWPGGLPQKRSTDQVMGYIDIMPTLLAIAGNRNVQKKPFDGINMLPVLTGKVKYINRNFYLGFGTIVNQDWKFISAAKASGKMELSGDQLFHISTDNAEKQNVLKDHRQAAAALGQALLPYNEIKPSAVLPPFAQGRKGFIAPKDWTIENE